MKEQYAKALNPWVCFRVEGKLGYDLIHEVFIGSH